MDSQGIGVKTDSSFDLFCKPGLRLNDPSHRDAVRKKMKQNYYGSIILIISGCNRDHYASDNYRGKRWDQGPNKYNQNSGEFEINWHGLVKINDIINSSGHIREEVNQLRNFVIRKGHFAGRIGHQGKTKLSTIIQRTFQGMKYGNLFLSPIIPWAVDSESFRLGKEFLNIGIKKKIDDGWKINSKKVKWAETKDVYEIPFKELLNNVTYTDRFIKKTYVHYKPCFMNRIVMKALEESQNN